MLDFHDVPAIERVIVALDCSEEEALGLATSLEGKAKWMKIGMTLYYAAGPRIVKALKERGFNVFLDLKFYDIPHQVEGAAYAAILSGADMITMHASGSVAMMEAALRGAEKAATHLCREMPITLGITVLTSMNDETLDEIGVTRNTVEQVKMLAGLTAKAGISGVVCSPQEAPMLREALGPDAYIVTPGVRPAGADLGDQSRVTTPRKAFENGSSHIVVGRPITAAPDPVVAFDAIAAELSGL